MSAGGRADYGAEHAAGLGHERSPPLSVPIDGCEVGECVGATPSTSDILGSFDGLGGHHRRAAETGGARGADARAIFG